MEQNGEKNVGGFLWVSYSLTGTRNVVDVRCGSITPFILYSEKAGDDFQGLY